ncbi:MAG: hypothetical protein Q9162_001515 [Coniocarpon cinnabarinum]
MVASSFQEGCAIRGAKTYIVILVSRGLVQLASSVEACKELLTETTSKLLRQKRLENSSLEALVVIVDKVSTPDYSLTATLVHRTREASRGESPKAFPNDCETGVGGEEGVAYCATTHKAFEPVPRQTEEYGSPPISKGIENITEHSSILSFDLSDHQSKKLGHTQLSLPIANTLFQTGESTTAFRAQLSIQDQEIKVNTVFQDRSAIKSVKMPWPALRKVNRVNGAVRSKNGAWAADGATFRLPLQRLTPLRSIINSMGNVITTISPSEDSAAVPASQELEQAVSQHLEEHQVSGQNLTVWALIIPTMPLRKGAIDKPLRRNLRDQWQAGKKPEPIQDQRLIEQLVWRGAKLRRVLSGGGGWGQKAGLLSLDPKDHFEVGTDRSFESLPALMEELKFNPDVNFPSISRKGDQIVFFAFTTENDSLSTIDPSSDAAERPASPFSMTFGVLPSSMDAIFPDVDGAAQENSHEPLFEQYPGHFGAFSEGGMSIARPKMNVQTKLDTPGTCFSLSTSKESEIPADALREGQVSLRITRKMVTKHNTPVFRKHNAGGADSRVRDRTNAEIVSGGKAHGTAGQKGPPIFRPIMLHDTKRTLSQSVHMRDSQPGVRLFSTNSKASLALRTDENGRHYEAHDIPVQQHSSLKKRSRQRGESLVGHKRDTSGSSALLGAQQHVGSETSTRSKATELRARENLGALHEEPGAQPPSPGISHVEVHPIIDTADALSERDLFQDIFELLGVRSQRLHENGQTVRLVSHSSQPPADPKRKMMFIKGSMRVPSFSGFEYRRKLLGKALSKFMYNQLEIEKACLEIDAVRQPGPLNRFLITKRPLIDKPDKNNNRAARTKRAAASGVKRISTKHFVTHDRRQSDTATRKTSRSLHEGDRSALFALLQDRCTGIAQVVAGIGAQIGKIGKLPKRASIPPSSMITTDGARGYIKRKSFEVAKAMKYIAVDLRGLGSSHASAALFKSRLFAEQKLLDIEATVQQATRELKSLRASSEGPTIHKHTTKQSLTTKLRLDMRRAVRRRAVETPSAMVEVVPDPDGSSTHSDAPNERSGQLFASSPRFVKLTTRARRPRKPLFRKLTNSLGLVRKELVSKPQRKSTRRRPTRRAQRRLAGIQLDDILANEVSRRDAEIIRKFAVADAPPKIRPIRSDPPAPIQKVYTVTPRPYRVGPAFQPYFKARAQKPFSLARQHSLARRQLQRQSRRQRLLSRRGSILLPAGSLGRPSSRSALARIRFRAWLADYAHRVQLLRQMHSGHELDVRMQKAKAQATRSPQFTFYSRLMGRLSLHGLRRMRYRARCVEHVPRTAGQFVRASMKVSRPGRGLDEGKAVKDVEDLFEHLEAQGVLGSASSNDGSSTKENVGV